VRRPLHPSTPGTRKKGCRGRHTGEWPLSQGCAAPHVHVHSRVKERARGHSCSQCERDRNDQRQTRRGFDPGPSPRSKIQPRPRPTAAPKPKSLSRKPTQRPPLLGQVLENVWPADLRRQVPHGFCRATVRPCLTAKRGWRP
jgi:hypothetical protein